MKKQKRKNRTKTDFRNSNQNRSSVETGRDSRSHANFNIKNRKKIFKKKRKRVFETRIRIEIRSKLSEVVAITLKNMGKKTEKQSKNRF